MTVDVEKDYGGLLLSLRKLTISAKLVQEVLAI